MKCPSQPHASFTWNGKSYLLSSTGEAYVGVPLGLELKKETVFPLILQNGERYEVPVRAHEYPLETIHLQPQKQGLMAPDKLNKESNVIGGLFKTFSRKKQWQSQFLMPAHGRVSSEFGIRRHYYVQKKMVSQWQHRGVDITAPAGTEIIAPAAGKVILSVDFESHGGTLMIDHGLGVVSVFNHLKTRQVKAGSLVSAGDVIATMGDSGIATGSNVHWGLSVNGARVDPLQWTHDANLVR